MKLEQLKKMIREVAKKEMLKEEEINCLKSRNLEISEIGFVISISFPSDAVVLIIITIH
jgi:hypothetical protein